MKRKGLAKVDHTPPIEPEDLKQMYCSVALNPNTPVGLQQKVWFDVMFFLCRRGRENLRTMTKTSFGMKTDRTGTYVYQAQDELDKNHRESADPLESNTDGRMYEMPGHPLCPVSSFMKYINKLNATRDDLWQRPKDFYTDDYDCWYTNQPLGKNTLGNMMKTTCTQAKLKQIFTNHSCVTVLDFNKFESRDIMTVSGHKSENSLKSYTNQTSVKRKHEMSSALSASLIDQGTTINTTDNVNTPSFDTDDFVYMSEAELQELCNIDPTSSKCSTNTCQVNNQVLVPNNTTNVLKYVENITDGRFVPYFTGCVVNFNINMK